MSPLFTDFTIILVISVLCTICLVAMILTHRMSLSVLYFFLIFFLLIVFFVIICIIAFSMLGIILYLGAIVILFLATFFSVGYDVLHPELSILDYPFEFFSGVFVILMVWVFFICNSDSNEADHTVLWDLDKLIYFISEYNIFDFSSYVYDSASLLFIIGFLIYESTTVALLLVSTILVLAMIGAILLTIEIIKYLEDMFK
jgi:NADH:ubiquinone oxidoreductase subunit 6 (subunit J)